MLIDVIALHVNSCLCEACRQCRWRYGVTPSEIGYDSLHDPLLWQSATGSHRLFDADGRSLYGTDANALVGASRRSKDIDRERVSMPISGITEVAVRAAVAELEREGRAVSLKTVRAQLGRGSYTTLLRHLNRIAPRVDDARRTPPPAKALQEEIDALLRRVWSIACQEAAKAESLAHSELAHKLDARGAQIAADVAQLQVDANRLMRRLARTERDLQQVRLGLRAGLPPQSAEAFAESGTAGKAIA